MDRILDVYETTTTEDLAEFLSHFLPEEEKNEDRSYTFYFNNYEVGFPCLSRHFWVPFKRFAKTSGSCSSISSNSALKRSYRSSTGQKAFSQWSRSTEFPHRWKATLNRFSPWLFLRLGSTWRLVLGTKPSDFGMWPLSYPVSRQQAIKAGSCASLFLQMDSDWQVAAMITL